MKAAFLDRDGVINERAPEGEWIARWEAIQFLPDVFSSVAALEQAGFKIIIVTNQRGLALGKIRLADLEDIHRHFHEEFARRGVSLEGIYVCPHGLADHCSCRKPNPGLLIRAAEEHSIDLPSSWVIGDRTKDIEAGKRAGCKTARILAPGSIEREGRRADICSSNLASAVSKILQLSQMVTPPTNA
jgi:histidinol-phosphate phosphatase family protein